jgi:peptide/nickel transport system substrate-binding protein
MNDLRPATLTLTLALACLAATAFLSHSIQGQEAPAVAAGLLGSPPFDRLTLTDKSIIDVEPVSPRPLPPYDPKKEKARKSTGPPRQGNIFSPAEKARNEAVEEREKEAEPPPSEITIHLLKGDAHDFRVKRSSIQRVEYFEDMLLHEGERYRLAHDYARAFECYLRVQARVPGWPGLDEHVDRLLFDEGSAALNDGTGENGLRLLGELAARRPDYPGLADKLAAAYGSRIARAFELGLYAQGRKVLHDLEPLAPNHAVVREARERFIGRARALVAQAAKHQGAERLDALTEALRVWPELEGAGAQYAQAFAALPTLDVAVPDVPRTLGPFVRCRADERISTLLYLPILAAADLEAAQGKRPGQLAAQLESAELGRRLTIQIRPAIAWSDGSRPVSASDVVQALVGQTDPGSPGYRAGWADLLERAEALDEARLELRLARPLLKTEAWFVIPVGPAHLGAGGRPESATAAHPLVGDGPYRCVAAQERGIELRAVADAAAPDRPAILRIRETRYPTSKATIGALLRGEVSLAAHVAPDSIADLSARPDVKVGKRAQPSLHRIALDGRNPALRHRTLRRGLSLAIDRKALVEETLLRRPSDALNRVADGPFARGSYADAIDVKPLDHDPVLARMLVAAARKELGGDPIKLTLEYPAIPEPQAVVPKLVEAFAAAGVEVVAVERPESELESKLRAGAKFDLAYRAGPCAEPILGAGGAICAGIDAPASADPLSSVASPRILQLLLQLERAPEWPTAKGLALQIDRECRDELPILPLWQLEDHCAWRTRLEGPAPVADHLYQGIETWRIEPWFARDAWLAAEAK